MRRNLRIVRIQGPFEGEQSRDVQELASGARDALEIYIRFLRASANERQRLSNLRLALGLLERIACLEMGESNW